jgi:transcriptional regulator with XRE-family HTH domain
MTPQKGAGVKKTIRELREERGETRAQLAKTLGVMPNDVAEWELGRAAPTISRLRALTEHFAVRDDEIELRPRKSASLIARLAGWS